MTNPISQAAVDAAKQVLLDEGCLDQEHYPGYRDAVVTTALESAIPELLDQIEQLQAVVRDQHDDCVYQTRLAAVEKVHSPVEAIAANGDTMTVCDHCVGDLAYVFDEQVNWPCVTIKAARGE